MSIRYANALPYLQARAGFFIRKVLWPNNPWTNKTINAALKAIASLKDSNPNFEETFEAYSGRLERVKVLFNKYSSLNAPYEQQVHEVNRAFFDPEGPPLLTVALSTGLEGSIVRSPYPCWNPEVEADISFIVNEIPESLTSKAGAISLHDGHQFKSGLTPLALAYLNKNVPYSLLEQLIKNSPNPLPESNCISIPRKSSFDQDMTLLSQIPFDRFQTIIRIIQKVEREQTEFSANSSSESDQISFSLFPLEHWDALTKVKEGLSPEKAINLLFNRFVRDSSIRKKPL